MRSLKRMFTMLLVFAMLITSVGITAFADSQFSDITDSKVEVAVDKLVAYGIINGYEDGTFKPDNQITRAEFAAIVTRMAGVADSLPTDAVTGFADLDNDPTRAWARPYVKAAVDLKIINGFEDGTFRAGEPVTYEQAVKMLVCAIGYEVIAQSELKKLQAINSVGVTWSSGYIAAANKHGLTKGAITGQITLPASRGVVAILTSNSVDAPKLQEDENGNLSLPGEGEETQNNVITISGTVTGTYYTGLDDDNTGLSEREITIYSTKEGEETYTLKSSLAKSIDFDKYIGRKVDAYYDNLEGEITELKLRSTSSTIIDESEKTSFDGTTLKYTTNGTDKKTQSLSGYTYIVNGKYVDSFDLENDFKNGTIELFTAATDGGTVNIAKINSYEVFVVNNFDKTNEKIYFKYGDSPYEFPSRGVDKPKIYVNNSLVPFDNLSLSQYAVINLLESPDDAEGPKLAKMYVTTGAKTGKVTKQIGGSTERKVVLDGETMYLTNKYDSYESPDEKAPFELSESYTYYLDYTGQIAAVNYNSSAQTGNWSFGYLIDAGDDDDGDPAVKILTTSGQKPIYKLKDTIKLDGEKKKADTAIGLLETSASEYKTNAERINNLSGDVSFPSDYAQPVRYSYSTSTGKIEAMDTVVEGDPGTSDNFVFSKGGNGTATTTWVKFGENGSYKVDSSTTVVYVPNSGRQEDYDVMKVSTAFAVTTGRYFDVLAVDGNNTAKMLLVYGRNNPTYNFLATSPYMLVYENQEDKLIGYINGSDSYSEDGISISEDYFETEMTSSIVDPETDDDENDTDEDGYVDYLVSADAVDYGDIIRYITNAKGEIIAIQMIYDASEGGVLASGVKFERSKGSGDIVMRYGTAEGKGATDNTIDILCGEDIKTYKTSSTKFFKISDGELTTTVADDVKVPSTHEESSTVIVITTTTGDNASAKVIYIVE